MRGGGCWLDILGPNNSPVGRLTRSRLGREGDECSWDHQVHVADETLGARRGVRRETNRGLVAVTASVPAMTANDEIVSVAIADVRRAWILRWPRHMGGPPVIRGHTVRVGPSTEIQSKAGAAVSRTFFAAARLRT